MSDIKRYKPSLIGSNEEKPKTDPQGWLVLAIALVILVIFFCWLFYTLSADSKPAEIIQRCNPGLCAFDIFSGRKRCPPPGQVEGLRIAPGAEFCTSANFCQQEPFTCAIQLDQSWRCDGVCGTGNEECRCIADPTTTV